MRNFKIRKLSRENFIESYGVIPRTKVSDGIKPKRHSMINFGTKHDSVVDGRAASFDDCDIMSKNIYHLDHLPANNNNNNHKMPTYTCLLKSEAEEYKINEEDPQEEPPVIKTSFKEVTLEPKVSYKGPSNRRVRKFSLKKFPSTGDIHRAVTKRSKNSDSMSTSDSKGSWLSSWSSQLSLNKSSTKSSLASAASFLTPSKSSSSSTTRRAAVFRIPAASFAAPAHKGYLDRRNKKKHWERYWCLLQDSCLYLYNSPQSEVTQDAVVLRGYSVIADIANINRSVFPIRLERSGSPSLTFRCDSHRNFVVWVETLKKDLARVMTEMSDNEVLVNSVKTTARQFRRPTISGHKLSPTEESSGNIVSSEVSSAQNESLEVQKENLLREVLSQQQELLRDHSQISPEFARSISDTSESYTPRRRKSDVIGKYEREKDNYENKILKSLTLLNRRRNSIQIKVDQLTKQLAPRNGRNVPNSMLLSEMEARLEQFQQQLNKIDKSIDSEQGKRLDTAEKIRHKRDLELLILDQRESMEIVRRHQQQCGRIPTIQVSRTRSSPSFAGNIVNRSSDQLTSIDEASTIISEETTSSSCTSSNDGFHSIDKTVIPRRVPLGRALSSTPVNFRLSHSNSELHTVRMRKKINLSNEFGDRRHSSEFNLTNNNDETVDILHKSYSNVNEGLSDDFRSLSTSSYSDVDMASDQTSRRTSSCATTNSDEKMEVSAVVMAEIEDFEVFSKMKLQKLGACY